MSLDRIDFDIFSLAAAYRDGSQKPREIVGEVFRRIAAHGDDPIFISVRSEADVLAEATALESAADLALPLYGIPFAVKDNIDVAGMATTAGCPSYAYTAGQSAFVVDRLRAAGALLIGKTNLDQFATGLVGVRSPYGVPQNAFDADYVPGGSSSGSATAVARGLVSFALGTDTAGSGRVPAAFNNVVGLKPTRGALSCAGVVPAVRGLDCVSVFAGSVREVFSIFSVAQAFDPVDPYARRKPAGVAGQARTIGVIEDLRAVDAAFAERYRSVAASLTASGYDLTPIDFGPLQEAAGMLYGAFVAERYLAFGESLEAGGEGVDPTVRDIVLPGRDASAVEALRAQHRIAALRRQTEEVFASIDALLLPTVPRHPTVAEVAADPIRVNNELGRFTNFANLLDLCGVAVPAGMTREGMPIGVSLFAPAFCEERLARVAQWVHESGVERAGVCRLLRRHADWPADRSEERLALCVFGAHLSGQPLNRQLVDLGAELVGDCETSANYRAFALDGPPRPALVRDESAGASIRGEIWEMTAEAFGTFVAGVRAPLCIGQVELVDGRRVAGFLSEATQVMSSPEITHYGGWLPYLEANQAWG